MAGKCTRTRAPLARKYTNRILESQDGTTSIKYYIVSKDTTCLGDFEFLTNSNRTTLRSYKEGERTFGTTRILYSGLTLTAKHFVCDRSQPQEFVRDTPTRTIE